MRAHIDIQGGSSFRDAAANAAVAHNALAAILGLEIGMLGEKIRDLGLDRLRQQRARPLPQDFGELIVKGSWLNQFEHVIVGHGISLLQWRSGVVKQPHDMPPFRFLPSPTFSNSSVRARVRTGGYSNLRTEGHAPGDKGEAEGAKEAHLSPSVCNGCLH